MCLYFTIYNTTAQALTDCIRNVGSKATIKSDSNVAKLNVGSKTVYWPNDFNKYPEVTMERSYQTENFFIVWGTKVGLDPKTASNTNLRFDPVVAGNVLESYYDIYVNHWHWLNDTTGNLSTYKIIVVMNETWNDAPWKGYAFGGSYDDTIGAMWIAPVAISSTSTTLAHELAHSFQSQTLIDHTGKGFNDEASGFFWEKHAEYMTSRVYPDILAYGARVRAYYGGHYHFNSTRKHYEDISFLHFIEDQYGLDMNLKVWREANSTIDENPLEAYRRILNMDVGSFGDFYGKYVQKSVFFDFLGNYGNSIRHYNWVEGMNKQYQVRKFTLLDQIGNSNTYKTPTYISPQDYGKNLIELDASDALSNDGNICMKFYGFPNGTAGGVTFRFSFIATPDQGINKRYSEIYRTHQSQEFSTNFKVYPNEKVYLVVTAIPNVHHRYLWEPGYPKIYRYPWQIKIEGATPTYNAHEGIAGNPHPNGGGFVASTAQVDPSVYVGPNATVLGNSVLRNNVRIENQAMVCSSNLSDNVLIRDAGVAIFSNASGDVVVEDSASLWWKNSVTGSAIFGGDSEGYSDCDSGHYLQVAHPNNNRKSCDGHNLLLTDNDINPVISSYNFSDQQCTNTCDNIIKQGDISGISNLNTSHVSPWETLSSVTDGNEPINSADRSNGVYGNWNSESNFNQLNWVEFTWNNPVEIQEFEVYWFDDNRGIEVPYNAYIEYWNGIEWVFYSNIGTNLNMWNILDQIDVTTDRIRLNMQSQKATGIIEARVNGIVFTGCDDQIDCTLFDKIDENCKCSGSVVNQNMNQECDSQILSVLNQPSMNTKLSDISIYPIPTYNDLNISTDKVIEKVNLYDLSGKMLNTFHREKKINLSSIPDGIYIINIHTEKEKYFYKIIKSSN